MARTAPTWCSMGRRRTRSTSGRSSRATRRTKPPRVPSSRTDSVRRAAQDAAGPTGTPTHTLTVVASGGGPPPPSPPGAPTTSASVDGAVGANGWHLTAVNVTLTATSPSGSSFITLYSLDKDSWTTYARPFVVGDGDHML